MRLPMPTDMRARVRPRDLIAFAPGVNAGDVPAAASGDIVHTQTWVEARDWLARKHGRSARVAVFPSAAIQLGGEVVAW